MHVRACWANEEGGFPTSAAAAKRSGLIGKSRPRSLRSRFRSIPEGRLGDGSPSEQKSTQYPFNLAYLSTKLFVSIFAMASDVKLALSMRIARHGGDTEVAVAANVSIVWEALPT